MPDPKTICTVRANGMVFRSWKSITISHPYGDLIPTFQLVCSEGGPLGGANDSRRLVPQTPVTIELGGQLALTGAIEQRLASYDANSHDVIIGGRSQSSVATLSSMPFTGGNLNGFSAEQAARAALAPHGTNLVVKNPPANWSKPFPFLAVNPGEYVHEFLERIFKMRGAFAWGDEKGNICVGQGDPKAAVVAELQEGRNILRATVKLDDQGIFSAMHIYGQQPGQGDDMSVRTAEGVATDPSAKTTRVFHQHAEMNCDSQDATARANLEAARSSWDRVEATVTVAGWFRPDGSLWGLTDNISFYSPMGLPNGTGKMPSDNPLGVQNIVYSQDSENGTTTTLTLVRAALLTSTPPANVQSDGKGGYVGDGPSAATPVAPDYQSGISIGPGGQLGHA
ncbi:MAG: phage baseplate assembly protein [Janthinobacterium lividum]